MEYDLEKIEQLGGRFLHYCSGRAICEFNNIGQAKKAIEAFSSADAYNWCPVQQPKGPNNRKPTIWVAL